MEGFLINTERIARTGGSVSDTGTALAREISAMHDILGQIRAGWQSTEAAPRFAAAMDGYLAEATVLKDALLSHGTSLVATAQHFGRAESALADELGVVR